MQGRRECLGSPFTPQLFEVGLGAQYTSRPGLCLLCLSRGVEGEEPVGDAGLLGIIEDALSFAVLVANYRLSHLSFCRINYYYVEALKVN